MRGALGRTLLLGLGLAVTVTGLVVGAGPATASQKTVTLTARQTTFIDSSAKSKNFGSYPFSTLSKSRYRTFLAFDTSGIASGTVVSAALTTTVTSSPASKPGVLVSATGTGWSSTTLTWQDQPTTESAVLNPGDQTTARAGSSVTSHLTGMAGRKLGTATAFALSYSQSGTEVRLSKTTLPTLTLVVDATTTPSATTSPTSSVTPAAVTGATSATSLPYDTAGLGSTKKVFAHYFPPYPISIDNKPAAVDYYTRNYLNPAGENGKFRSVGGLLRDRPATRAPLTGDYRYLDALTDVRTASADGLDGFMTNIMGWSSDSWTGSLRIAQAAGDSQTGFVVMPNLDMASGISSKSVADVAQHMDTFFKQSGAYRMSDGRYALSVYYAENKPVSYYQSLISTLKSDYGINVALTNIYLSLSDAQIKAYAPVSYAMGTWGARSAPLLLSYPNRAAAVHAYGVKWISPIAVQDVRHHTLSFAESGNTELLRASWKRAIDDGADMAQMVTWNDYSESTSFAPSIAHGNAFLDLNGYYLTRFKEGTTPSLTGDELIVTHRIQKVGTQPLLQSAHMTSTLSGSKTTPRDTVEVVCLCSGSGTVTLTVGGSTSTFSAPAGVSAFTAPLQYGSVSARLTRNGTTVATATSTHTVVSSINYWDLQYYAATSREGA